MKILVHLRKVNNRSLYPDNIEFELRVRFSDEEESFIQVPMSREDVINLFDVVGKSYEDGVFVELD